MSYLKPAWFPKHVFNPLAMRFGISNTAVLEVPRRQSGGVQRVPVIPVDLGGSRYIVSTRGESDWVRNLRAAGGRVELGSREDTRPFSATELPAEQRPPIIAAYREKAGKTVEAYWKKLPDPEDHPVFRLEAG